MTSRELTRYGRRYLKRLQAEEWLRGTMFRVRNLDGLYGMSEWFVEERCALITVHRGLSHEDTMTTLIHEILHVVLEGHKPPTAHSKYDPNYELALNRLAKALWNEWGKQ
jgi:hypothetical protein